MILLIYNFSNKCYYHCIFVLGSNVLPFIFYGSFSTSTSPTIVVVLGGGLARQLSKSMAPMGNADYMDKVFQ